MDATLHFYWLFTPFSRTFEPNFEREREWTQVKNAKFGCFKHYVPYVLDFGSLNIELVNHFANFADYQIWNSTKSFFWIHIPLVLAFQWSPFLNALDYLGNFIV